jgi:hypothetical protein
LGLRKALIGFIVLVLVVGLGVYLALRWFGDNLPTPLGRACEVTSASGTVGLEADQMANAATIAAVGIVRRLPDRAIVVALAVALQESKLQNITHGDRDSVGLFQQRPSQGWGTEQQILDPRYAAGHFYAALVRVRGWEQMRVTEAAQRVQRSAYPEAYERWTNKASVLAEALAGRVTGAVACTRVGQPAQRGIAAAQALGVGLRLDWGEVQTVATSEVVGLVVAASDQRAGWQYAHWLVAHSGGKGVERVRYGKQEWTAERGEWARVDGERDAGGRVIAEVYLP